MPGALNFIHQFIPGSSERTLLLLHGTGGDEGDLIPLGRELDPEAAFLSPRGKVLENGHPRFFRRLADGVFDLEDLEVRTNELADFVVAATRHYRIDARKMVAVGYSNGANMAASILLRRPGILSEAVLFRAMVPFVPDAMPDLAGTRVWIAGGKNDGLIPPVETERLADLLRAAKAEVTLQLIDADHGLTKTELVLARRWLAALTFL